MLLMGYIADQIGRKWGSVLTATFMFIGGILLTCSTGPTIQGWAIMFAVAQFIFGYGVGGELPVPEGSWSQLLQATKLPCPLQHCTRSRTNDACMTCAVP